MITSSKEDPTEFTVFGGESEEDVSPETASEVSKSVLWSTDWTIETVFRQLEKGNIDVNPDFQRREAWNDTKKSRFIESILLGLPIPQIVLAEKRTKPGTYIVIDGKQRLLTIRRFCASSHDPDFKTFNLQGLNIRRDLNGLSYEDFSESSQHEQDFAFFENQTVRTTIIRNWPSENFLYTVFLRLNTESVPLSPQELRQALHPGPFLTFADRYTRESKIIPQLLRRSTPDFRMRDVELFVRYFAFYYYLEKYKGNLKLFLDEACKDLNETFADYEDEITETASKLEQAVTSTMEIFGEDHAFRKYDKNHYETRFNRAIFDIMVYYFSGIPSDVIRKNSLKIKKSFESLCSDPDFVKSIESTTKSISATATRFRKWGDKLQELLKLDLAVPQLKDGKIEIL